MSAEERRARAEERRALRQTEDRIWYLQVAARLARIHVAIAGKKTDEAIRRTNWMADQITSASVERGTPHE